jgi:hypothetical protein
MTELDEQTKVARQREAEFFEWYEKTSPYLHLYNTRQIFDLAYDKGYIAGIARVSELESELEEKATREAESVAEFENRPIDDYGDEINGDDYINYLNN